MVNVMLGDKVKKRRKDMNLSQSELAENAHISVRTVCDIETYKGNPQFDTLCALASYMDISIDSIIHGSDIRMDSTMQQILYELNDCSEETKQIALGTLRGLLAVLPKDK